MFSFYWKNSLPLERMNKMFPWNFSPFNKDFMKMLDSMKPEEMEKYIYDMMEKMMPKDSFSRPNKKKEKQDQNHDKKLKWEVFETLDFVYVMIPVKEHWIEHIKLFITSNQLIIKNIPHEGDKHIIVLPAVVRKKGTTAQVKDEMLEVKIPKDIDIQFSEIGIIERK